jgi:hypothetical protein
MPGRLNRLTALAALAGTASGGARGTPAGAHGTAGKRDPQGADVAPGGPPPQL